MTQEVSTELKSMLKIALDMWTDEEQLKTIKSIYAKDATDSEFKIFVQLGLATNLNPFKRELWLVKYDKSAAAQIFIGRDGYRTAISRNPMYLNHQVDAVYSNDDFMFDLTKGEIRHTYNLKDRGKLIGGYCIVYMKTSPKPYYVFVDINEYNTGRSVWKDKPATMIKKVAECQAIRMADSVTFGGTYEPDELEQAKQQESSAQSLTKKLEKLTNSHETIEGETVKESLTVPELSMGEKALGYFEKRGIPNALIFSYFDISDKSELTDSMVSIMSDIKLAIVEGSLKPEDAFIKY